MPTMCIQCALEAQLKGERAPLIEESPQEHMRRVHPDLVATKARRKELIRLLMEKEGFNVDPQKM